jgi:hypothetical protein
MPPLTGDDDGTTGYAVYGSSRRGGYSLVGDSDSNYGVYGTSISNYGLFGSSSYRAGVYGTSPFYYGVVGESYSGGGVYGRSEGRYGYGVRGDNAYYAGVYGTSGLGYGVYGHSYNGEGVYGYGNNLVGVATATTKALVCMAKAASARVWLARAPALVFMAMAATQVCREIATKAMVCLVGALAIMV